MIVFDPNNTNHVFDIITRKRIESTVDLVLYNESTRQESIISATSTDVDDKTRISVVLSCSEGDSYTFKIVDSQNYIYYRGKIFVTSQEPQNYSSDNGLYTYSTI